MGEGSGAVERSLAKDTWRVGGATGSAGSGCASTEWLDEEEWFNSSSSVKRRGKKIVTHLLNLNHDQFIYFYRLKRMNSSAVWNGSGEHPIPDCLPIDPAFLPQQPRGLGLYDGRSR